MKRSFDAKYDEEESDPDDYWDIEEQLYEQYKELKIEGPLDDEFEGD